MLRFWLWPLVCLAACAGEPFQVRTVIEYSGMSDASAGVAIGEDLFVAASDEDNTLRLYRVPELDSANPSAVQPPIDDFNLNPFLELTGKSAESDLEAAARLDDLVFWITSHGRNKNAKQRVNRGRLFATEIRPDAAGMTVKPVGRPYKNLIGDLLAEPKLRGFNLDLAEDKAPKDQGGLNIEGLAATPEGHLLLGFRNPIPGGKALLVPLLNPREVIRGSRAQLGEPVQLDLGGLGVRDMVLHGREFLIIAGSYRGGGKFRLYRWSGAQSAAERLEVENWDNYNPEALILWPESDLKRMQFLSDDGERLINGVPAKQLKDPARRKFRSFWVARGS